MQELEKILEEIETEKVDIDDCLSVKDKMLARHWNNCIDVVKEIICNHMKDNKLFEFDFTNVRSFDCQCGRHYINTAVNDGWIPMKKELPPNAKHKGALCPRYQVMTKYGVTEGWYNPDVESWYVLIWFMTERYLESEIDFEKGAHPKMVRCGNTVNDKRRIVFAWRPLPEPYRPERSEE